MQTEVDSKEREAATVDVGRELMIVTLFERVSFVVRAPTLDMEIESTGRRSSTAFTIDGTTHIVAMMIAATKSVE